MKIILDKKDIAVALAKASMIVFVALMFTIFTSEFFLSKNKPSDDDLSLFFVTNASELKKIIPLCRDHPAIRWLGKKNGQISFYSSPSATQVDYETARLIRSILDPLGVGSIDCSRRFDVPGDTFLGVNFVIYARGLSISGEAKAIWFIQPALFEDSEGYKAMLRTGELKPLPEPGWYIYSSR